MAVAEFYWFVRRIKRNYGWMAMPKLIDTVQDWLNFPIMHFTDIKYPYLDT